MTTRAGIISAAVIKEQVELYERYLQLLRALQANELKLADGISTNAGFGRGELQIHSVPPSKPHFLATIRFVRGTIWIENEPAQRANSQHGTSHNPGPGLDPAASNGKLLLEDARYVLGWLLPEAYATANSLSNARALMSSAVEDNSDD